MAMKTPAETCGTCGGRGQVVNTKSKATSRGTTVEMKTVRCSECRGKGAKGPPIDLRNVVEALAKPKKPGKSKKSAEEDCKKLAEENEILKQWEHREL